MSAQVPVIAVINKDAAFVHLLDAALRDEGYQTLLLEGGDITFDSIKQQRPTLIILDIDLDAPTESWQLLDLLTLNPETAPIPLVICSVADQVLADRTPRLLAAGYALVQKPFALSELLDTVRSLLPP